MEKNDKIERAFQQDLHLLYEMYKNRALSTAQIAKIRNLGKWYVYEKIEKLREKGYIHSDQISGNYIPDQRRQGSYHKISAKGIALLKENGYQVDYTTDDLKVSKYRLPYLLTATDLSINLGKVGWKYRDSRDIKNFHALNRNDVLQGSLTNPNNDKEYALYIFLKKINPINLVKVKQEIIRNPFNSVLITTRGEHSFESVIKSFMEKEDKVIKGGSVKVLPFGFANSYLTISNDNVKSHEYFLRELGLVLLNHHSNKNVFETNINFDYLVEYQGKQMYFVDLLDNDLMKIEEIRNYRKEQYEHDGRKVLALTSKENFHMDFHKKMLGDISHIDYLTVDARKVVSFASNISNKRLFD